MLNRKSLNRAHCNDLTDFNESRWRAQCLPGRNAAGSASTRRGGYKKTRRRSRGTASLELAIGCLLKRRTAKPHRDFIGAVLCARVAHLIRVTHVAPSHTDEVLIGPVIRNRRDHYSITVDVDTGRIRPAPGEIHRVPALHSAP